MTMLTFPQASTFLGFRLISLMFEWVGLQPANLKKIRRYDSKSSYSAKDDRMLRAAGIQGGTDHLGFKTQIATPATIGRCGNWKLGM